MQHALGLLALLTLPLLGQDGQKAPAILPSLDPAELLADGFTALFNGEDLDGWKKVGGTGEFKVEDECVVGFGQNIRGNTFLRTKKSFSDFIFVFEFQFVDPGGNSGCQFRSAQEDGDGRVFGYQCEHDNNKDRSFTAGIYDESRRGWLYPGPFSEVGSKEKFTAQGQRLFKWDDWNRIVIRCKGNHIQTWLNGEPRADFKDTHEEHATTEGFIALQVHGGKSGHIRWRNLFLKPL
jgi:hypothetical protein